MRQVEAVANDFFFFDFDVPCVLDRHVEVHGRQSDVAPDTSAGLLADPGYSALKGQLAGCKNARVGAGAVISVLVKEATAGAGARTEGSQARQQWPTWAEP